MGWTYYQATHYKNGAINRKAECDNLYDSDNFSIVKSQMVGSTYYAAVHSQSDNCTFGVVCLTSVDKNYFGYKDMDETCGPYSYQCPKSILQLLSPTENEYAVNWRKKCMEYHEKKDILKKLPLGSVVEVSINDKILRFTKTMIGKYKKWVCFEEYTYIQENNLLLHPFTILQGKN